ncbi:hypothetical protein D3C80_1483690 [compost metagenome]
MLGWRLVESSEAASRSRRVLIFYGFAKGAAVIGDPKNIPQIPSGICKKVLFPRMGRIKTV